MKPNTKGKATYRRGYAERLADVQSDIMEEIIPNLAARRSKWSDLCTSFAEELRKEKENGLQSNPKPNPR